MCLLVILIVLSWNLHTLDLALNSPIGLEDARKRASKSYAFHKCEKFLPENSVVISGTYVMKSIIDHPVVNVLKIPYNDEEKKLEIIHEYINDLSCKSYNIFIVEEDIGKTYINLPKLLHERYQLKIEPYPIPIEGLLDTIYKV